MEDLYGPLEMGEGEGAATGGDETRKMNMEERRKVKIYSQPGCFPGCPGQLVLRECVLELTPWLMR